MLNPNGGCVTPSDLFFIEAERQAIEREIERIIIGDFRGSPAAIGAIDIFTDPGFNGPREVTEWLSRNSFGQTLNKTKMMQGFDAGEYSVPDIITNRVTNAKSEFYEIKPNSVPGKGEGLRKLAAFAKCVFRSIRPVISLDSGRAIRSIAAGGSRSEATLGICS